MKLVSVFARKQRASSTSTAATTSVVEYYSIEDQTWIMSEPLPMGCYGHGAVAVSGTNYPRSPYVEVPSCQFHTDHELLSCGGDVDDEDPNWSKK